jgi:hypothetical protein
MGAVNTGMESLPEGYRSTAGAVPPPRGECRRPRRAAGGTDGAPPPIVAPVAGNPRRAWISGHLGTVHQARCIGTMSSAAKVSGAPCRHRAGIGPPVRGNPRSARRGSEFAPVPDPGRAGVGHPECLAIGARAPPRRLWTGARGMPPPVLPRSGRRCTSRSAGLGLPGAPEDRLTRSRLPSLLGTRSPSGRPVLRPEPGIPAMAPSCRAPRPPAGTTDSLWPRLTADGSPGPAAMRRASRVVRRSPGNVIPPAARPVTPVHGDAQPDLVTDDPVWADRTTRRLDVERRLALPAAIPVDAHDRAGIPLGHRANAFTNDRL